MAIRGLLFDKDGTLFDFAATWGGVTEMVLDRLADDPAHKAAMATAIGYDTDAGHFQAGSAVVAGTGADIAELLAQMAPKHNLYDIEMLLNESSATVISGGLMVPAVPDMAGFLDGLRADGHRLGIATHDAQDAAHAHMDALGVVDRFDFIAGYDSGHGHKPGPGMLLAFAKSTGLHPSEIAMIGDSIHDLGVAPAAGAALAIGVLTGPATREDLAPHADHVLDSIADLPALLAARL